MSLRFIDSFDHYTETDGAAKWTSFSGPIIGASYGRFGNGVGSGSGSISKTLDNQQTWIVGFAIKVTSLSGRRLLRLIDGGTIQLELYMRVDGTLSVYRNGLGEIGSAVLGTTSFVLSTNTWHFIEFKAYIDNTSGTVDVYVDEVNVLSLDSTDTQNSSNASANIIRLDPSITAYYDDVYICDGQGTTNNDILGDCKVECLFPDANGSTVEFTPSAGLNYENVDDATPDDDATYNSSGSVTAKDLFSVDDLATLAGDVYGVQANVWARKDDAGGRNLGLLAYSGVVEDSGGDTGLSTDFTYIIHCFETSPSSGSIWTISEVNAAEFGYEVTA